MHKQGVKLATWGMMFCVIKKTKNKTNTHKKNNKKKLFKIEVSGEILLFLVSPDERYYCTTVSKRCCWRLGNRPPQRLPLLTDKLSGANIQQHGAASQGSSTFL